MSSSNSPLPSLPEAPKKGRGRLFLLIAAIAVVIIAAVAIIVPVVRGSQQGERGSSPDNPIRIGVVGKSNSDWAAYQQAAKKDGIYIELVDFGQYEQVNPALSEGDIELNVFQHIPYLVEYNSSSGEDLQPIGTTAIYPLGLFSKKYESVEEIPADSTIAVSNSPSNQARALLILQEQGLVKLKDGGTPFSRLDDIDEDASKVKVIEQNPELTPNSLDDVAAAFINNDFVEDAGLKFEDAIAKDDPSQDSAAPYVNIFVSRPDDVDNETYKRLVEIWQTDKTVLREHQKNSGDTAEFVRWDRDRLQELYKETTKQYEAAS